MKKIAFLSLLLLGFTAPALADCSAPYGVPGTMQFMDLYVNGSEVLYVCDGASWNTMQVSDTGSMCTEPGQIKYNTTTNSMEVCATWAVGMYDWYDLKGVQASGSCTVAGKMSYLSFGRYAFCDGANIYYTGVRTYPSYITDSTGSDNSGTTCRAAKPSNLKIGDLILTSLTQNGGSGGLTAPAGYTQIGTEAGPIATYYSYKHYKIADASDILASYITFTRAAGIGTCSLLVMVIRNVDQTTPIAGNDTIADNTLGTTLNFNGLTATKDHSLSLAIGESTGGTPTNPAGYTSQTTTATTRVSSKQILSAGAVSAFTSSSAAGRRVSTHLIINPQ